MPSEKQGVKIANNFTDYLFNNRKQWRQLYIPNEYSEMFLLLCRTYIDKRGQWIDKHQQRFNTILKTVNAKDFLQFAGPFLSGDILSFLSHTVLKRNIGL